MHVLIHKCAWFTVSMCMYVVLTTTHMSFPMKYMLHTDICISSTSNACICIRMHSCLHLSCI
ncbi:hypothetical protein U9M48_004244 [Paspalum notatum var. saurae]|uniref:Uncharacterized protein n=1 Tax=Paspalum notatum var. saurae TaxID=547442 RepID=A0AAQ3PNC4_PASNO